VISNSSAAGSGATTLFQSKATSNLATAFSRGLKFLSAVGRQPPKDYRSEFASTARRLFIGNAQAEEGTRLQQFHIIGAYFVQRDHRDLFLASYTHAMSTSEFGDE
jgi:hypothetical protein